MTILNEGKDPKRSHLLALASKFDIDSTKANAIIDEVINSANDWAKVAKDAGVTKTSLEQIAASFPFGTKKRGN
jgi:hypothetical protein